MLFERKPLRDDVGAEILERIIDGRLPSGTRINESHLAQALGISRTPLREAMLCLAAAGALDTDLGRGFSVPHFTGRQAVELLETLAVALPAAIRSGQNLELKDQIEARNLLGRARLAVNDPAVFCAHWHTLFCLFAGQSRNTVLRDECCRLVQLLLRYLREALARGWDPGPSLAGLQESLEALQQAERALAANRLQTVIMRMSADLAARFPAALAAPR